MMPWVTLSFYFYHFQKKSSAGGWSMSKKIVVLGRNYRGRSEVISGLKSGDLVITQGYDLVKSNDAVSVIQKNANPL